MQAWCLAGDEMSGLVLACSCSENGHNAYTCESNVEVIEDKDLRYYYLVAFIAVKP